MKYVKVSDGQPSVYPYTMVRLRNDHPQISFPSELSSELLAEFGIFAVEPVERPSSTTTHDPVEQPPQLVNGVWTQVWAMVNVSAEEAARRQQEANDLADAEAVKIDTFVQNFIAMTPQQVSNYVNANTGTLAQTRALLNKMALMILTLARREFRE